MSGDQPSASEPVESPIELIVSPEQAGMRFDVYLAAQFPTHSRVMLRKVINAAAAKVDGLRVKAAHRLRAGERISVTLPALAKEGPQPEDIPLEILYEDDAIAVINKPPGMVVHPAKGHWSGTLTAALQFHFDRLSKAGGPQRPGVVHRLDRDTSGVIVIAKTDSAHFQLSHQFEHRQVEKEYFALCAGMPDLDRDVVDSPIGAHPHQREKMAIRRDHTTSREAQTYLRSGGTLRRLRGRESTAQNRPHAPDPLAPGEHRLSRALRSPVRRPRYDHSRRNPPRPQRRSDSLGSPGTACSAPETSSSHHRRAAGIHSTLAARHRSGTDGTACPSSKLKSEEQQEVNHNDTKGTKENGK